MIVKQLLELPTETLRHIAFYLSTISRAQLSITCKRLNEILKTELKTAEECWHRYPDSAPLILTEVNWYAEKKFWDAVCDNWINDRYISAIINPYADGAVSTEYVTMNETNDQLFVQFYKIINDEEIKHLEIWDLTCFSDINMVFSGITWYYGSSASYLVRVETRTAKEFYLHSRDDFSQVKKFKFPLRKTNEFPVKDVNDRFILFDCEPGKLHIFDIETETWCYLEHEGSSYAVFYDMFSFVMSANTNNNNQWSIFRLDGDIWREDGSAPHRPPPPFTYDKIRNPETYICRTNEPGEFHIDYLKRATTSRVLIPKRESLREANSHIYIAYSNIDELEDEDPEIFSYNIYVVSERRKISQCQSFHDDIRLTEKYMMVGVADGFEIRDYKNGLVCPHYYKNAPIFCGR